MRVCITCDEHENPVRLTFNGILNLIRSIEEIEFCITCRFSNNIFLNFGPFVRQLLVYQNMCLLLTLFLYNHIT